MKRAIPLFLCLITLGFSTLAPDAFCQSADEVFEQFGRKYESLKPGPGSSVTTDYKLEQTALAAFYTAKMLSLLSRQNQELLTKYEETSKKYDRIINQNEKIIELLTALTKK
ncbi:MAG: hypothetical protein JXL84_23775 [Deltaproteobacteria bacterium]|nr:hypothetical protein [Deltaproteobacteria bacterium]